MSLSTCNVNKLNGPTDCFSRSLSHFRHTHVVRACQLFNIVEGLITFLRFFGYFSIALTKSQLFQIAVSKELRQTCYFMASNSLHLTTMCLKYKPTVVAAFCIYLACRWARWEVSWVSTLSRENSLVMFVVLFAKKNSLRFPTRARVNHGIVMLMRLWR